MFSWEIRQQLRDATQIGILVPPVGVSMDWAVAFHNLQRPSICEASRISGIPFGEARTKIAHDMLDGGFSYLFFLDCDVIVPPDTLLRLISHRLPIVSALYYRKYPKVISEIEVAYEPCMFSESDGKAVSILDFRPGSMVEAGFVGAGCLLIHRSVFEKLLEKGVKRFFEWTFQIDSAGYSEDFEFCKRVRSLLGLSIIVDTGIVAIHETDAKVTPKGLQPKL